MIGIVVRTEYVYIWALGPSGVYLIGPEGMTVTWTLYAHTIEPLRAFGTSQNQAQTVRSRMEAWA